MSLAIFVEGPTVYEFHSEESVCFSLDLGDTGVEYSNDVRMAEARQENGLTQGSLDFLDVVAGRFENLECLAPKESMLDLVDFCKRPFSKESLHLVVIREPLLRFKQWHESSRMVHLRGPTEDPK